MIQSTSPKLTECLLGAGSSITGTLSGTGIVRVEGDFEGSIQAHDAVILSQSARVKADISGNDVFIAGEFSGKIEARGAVHIAGSAVVIADILAKTLDLAAGASFSGHFERSST